MTQQRSKGRNGEILACRKKATSVHGWAGNHTVCSATFPATERSIAWEVVDCHHAVTCHQQAENRITVPDGLAFSYYEMLESWPHKWQDYPYSNLGLILQHTNCCAFRASTKSRPLVGRSACSCVSASCSFYSILPLPLKEEGDRE